MNSPTASPTNTPLPAPKARLKIFLGMAHGVGKTRAMLQEAQDKLDEGVRVVIGTVETHNRPETDVLLAGLPRLPFKSLPYQGTVQEEFDLQNALATKPQLVIMDDLAHVNVPGAVHPHRWQDVWDMLDAGIDVYTTLNIQQIESLKDVAAHITGVLVKHTVPDTLLHRADEIELVDLPPEELIQRFREGKVHVPDYARHATERYFKKSTLLAMRELALRRTADYVDGDMRRNMAGEKVADAWTTTNERLLVCIGPSEASANLIRATQRLSERTKAPWIAAYVEISKLKHSQQERHLVEEHLRLAERLGGETIVVQGDVSLAEDLVSLATSRNVTRILVGRPKGSRLLRAIRPSLVDQLVTLAENIDVMVVARHQGMDVPLPPAHHAPLAWLRLARRLALAAVDVALTTLLGLFMRHKDFELTDITMVYVLGILIAGYRFGLWPAAFASVLSALSLDFFFIPPLHTLGFSDGYHLGTFLIMLVIGLVIGNLAERMRAQVRLASERGQRTFALFKLAAEFARGGNPQTIAETGIKNIAGQFQRTVGMLIADARGKLVPLQDFACNTAEQEMAQWVWEHGEAAGRGTETFSTAKLLILPLKNAHETLGVLILRPMEEELEAEKRHLLDAFAQQTALALERALLVDKQAVTQRQVDQEQRRSALLSSVSKDLHLPLLVILDAAERILQSATPLPLEEQKALAETIHTKTYDLQRLLTNVLDIVQLEAGATSLDRQEISLAEWVQRTLQQVAKPLSDHLVQVDLPEKLIPVWIDVPLMERVLINLLENAAHCSPSQSPIIIRGWRTEHTWTLLVRDHGPGLPEGMEKSIFDKLVKAPTPYGKAGAGLGLAICKAIVEAHDGWIQGSNHPSGGAQFIISLPLDGARTGND